MQEQPESYDHDHRQAQLVEAAGVLLDWIYTRRATWSNLRGDEALDAVASPQPARPSQPIRRTVVPDTIPDSTLSPPQAVVPPLAAAPPATWSAPSPVAYDAGIVHEPAANVEPAKPGVQRRIPAAAIGSLATPPLQWLQQILANAAGSLGTLLRLSLRVGAVAAILALLVFAGSLARPYWVKATATPTGTAVLDSVPPGSEVFVDGAAAGTTPLTTQLAAGPHTIEFRRRGASRKLEIEVAGGQSTAGRVDWNAKPTGRLLARSDPAGARVLIDGRERGVTPLTIDLTVGSHTVVIQSNEGSVRRTVAVTADSPVLVSESIYGGFLKLFAPFDLQIMEGARGLRLDDQNQVLLPPGTHELVFENRALGFRETRQVEVNPGQTTSLSLIPLPSALTVTATEPATVTIDGERAGDTPLTGHPIALGTRDIIVRSAGGAERRYTQTVTTAPIQINVDFSR